MTFHENILSQIRDICDESMDGENLSALQDTLRNIFELIEDTLVDTTQTNVYEHSD